MKDGHAIVADLTKEADMKRAIEEAITKMGGLDILVNSGGAMNDEMEGQSEDAILAAIKLHVTGNLTLIRAAEEELVKNKGAVVNVSSVAAIIPFPSMNPYCVAKAAQDTLTRNLALEFATKGVRINSVLPGAIRTEVFEQMAEKNGITAQQVADELAVRHGMQRVAEPEEVAAPVVFLASDAASFITGVNLPVDGAATLGFWFNATKFPG
ncbi:NAD(P)-binding protein [Coccomyxa subellipsoidea C-169]|uniref:NAD(P)-binding protein n=1 Tax=Coccomyxa subellipsoidea (strain C-169) TaxID=574566 RepID=I0YYT3_COCSC|nr:NAD(P)-binding protein [Coccomyxa subellipsoidea C-169]EIE23552.1 NAD(P)-binding protein [Coccomyxa subellipsoidea C-169]|eukprot:XP_005648096.1 NAD(P)-binding protein [Coccomyxa subellipsoidea C-169]